MLFVTLWSLILLNLIPNVISLTNENLRSYSIAYGISSIVVEDDYKNLTRCHVDLEEFFNGINRNYVWSLRALDASGMPDSGFYDGNNFWIGSHQFCLEIQNRNRLKLNYNRLPPTYVINNQTYPPYKMKFFVYYIEHNSTTQVHFRINLDNKIILGLCVPETCELEDVKRLLDIYFERKYLTFQTANNLNLKIVEMKKLHDDGYWIFELKKTIIAIIILTLLLILLLIGTIYGNLQRKTSNSSITQKIRKGGKFRDYLLCFDVVRYFNTILSYKTPPSSSIECLNGLKIYYMLVIITAHTIFFKFDYTKMLSSLIRHSELFLIQIISNSSLAPDSFFFFSGLLVSYLFYTRKRRKNDDNCNCRNVWSLVKEYFNNVIGRYIRLTPTYAAVIIMSNVLGTYLKGNYPIHICENPDVNCDVNWWANMLYVNNFLYKKDMCLTWTYYNAIDMQMYLISTFILLLSTIFFKLAAFILIALIIVSVFYTAYVMYDIQLLLTLDDWTGQFDLYYHSPVIRGQSYLLGIIAGYLLAKAIEKKLKLKRVYVIILWISTTIANFYILFCLCVSERSVTFTMFYMSLSRIVWCTGLGWTIIACQTNNAGALNTLLSWKVSHVFSKVTYSVYLLNPLLIIVFVESSGITYNHTIGATTLDTLGYFFVCYLFAFFLAIAVEYPFINMYKLWNERNTKKIMKNQDEMKKIHTVENN